MEHRYKRGPILQQLIAKALYEHGPHTIPALADKLAEAPFPVDARAVRANIDAMERQGRVMKVAHGVYGHGQQDVRLLAMIRNRTAAPFAFLADLLERNPAFAKGSPIEVASLKGNPHSYAVVAGYLRKLKKLGAVRQSKRYGWFELTLALVEETAAER
jgi:hypothetical protein